MVTSLPNCSHRLRSLQGEGSKATYLTPQMADDGDNLGRLKGLHEEEDF